KSLALTDAAFMRTRTQPSGPITSAPSATSTTPGPVSRIPSISGLGENVGQIVLDHVPLDPPFPVLAAQFRADIPRLDRRDAALRPRRACGPTVCGAGHSPHRVHQELGVV